MTRPRALLYVIALLLGTYATNVSAQSKSECLSAFDRAQDERSRLLLRSSRDDFMFCARVGCSPPVRKDCAAMLEGVLHDLPSLVFAARLSNGAEVTDAAIFVDGERVTPDAGGLLAVDPGPHVIRFERPPYAAQEQFMVARIGEKSRLVLATFPQAGPESHDAGTSPASGQERRALSPWFWVAGAAGVVALGSFTVFALIGADKRSHFQDTCAPGCDAEQIGEVRSRFIAADVSLGVAAISLAVAAIVYIWDKPGPRTQRLARSF